METVKYLSISPEEGEIVTSKTAIRWSYQISVWSGSLELARAGGENYIDYS
jgi:hypothetical protein